eukprot:3198398-Rhodomonas_salina.1
MNECPERMDNCDAHAACINTQGSFLCACHDGWSSVGNVSGVACEDLNECLAANFSICDETMGIVPNTDPSQGPDPRSICVNTEGSFVCGIQVQDFGNVNALTREWFEVLKEIWKTCKYEAGRSTAGIEAGVEFSPNTQPELEGRNILITAFISDASYLRRSSPAAVPAFFVAGPAVEVQVQPGPRGFELPSAAVIKVPIDEDAQTEAAAQERVLRVHVFDSQLRRFVPVETLGVTSNGRAIRARINKFGVFVALAICRGGTVLTDDGCVACLAGSSSVEGDTECTKCQAGTYAGDGASECSACPSNHYSSDDAPNCDQCDFGTFALAGASTCTSCNTPGEVQSFSCQCPAGMGGESQPCDDVDECSDGSNRCSNLAECKNTEGGYTCECIDGFIGDGFACGDDDECDEDRCDSDATCVNTPGSFECRCNAGFKGDGTECEVDQPPPPCDGAGCEVDDSSEPCEESEGLLCHVRP